MIAPVLMMQFCPIDAPALIMAPGMMTVPAPMLADGETAAELWMRTRGLRSALLASTKHLDRHDYYQARPRTSSWQRAEVLFDHQLLHIHRTASLVCHGDHRRSKYFQTARISWRYPARLCHVHRHPKAARLSVRAAPD